MPEAAQPNITTPAAGSPAPADTPISQGVPSPPASSAGTPGAGSTTPPQASSSAAAAPEYADVLDVIRQADPRLAGQFQSGNAAVQYLIDQARQAQEASRWRSQFEPHLGEFQNFLAQRQQAEREAQARRNEWFKAPEYSPDWSRMIQRDAQGNLVPAPGAPAGVVDKYLQAMQHSRGFLEKFSFDPIGAIRPGIEQVVREIASQLVQQNLGGYAENSAATDFVSKNREWLYDPQGQLSQYGRLFAQSVQEAEQLGVRGVQGQQQYAMKAVQHAYAVAEWQRLNGAGQGAAQPAAAASPNQLQKDAFLQGANQNGQLPAGSPGATRQPAASVPAQPRPTGGSHSSRLTRMALDNAARAGVNVNGITVPN